jgi:predicted TIM-barrel fold metal-dependent hydrolase
LLIVDFHAHLEEIEGRPPTADAYVAEMDRAGVDKAVIYGVDQANFGEGVNNSWASLLRGPTTKKKWMPVPREMPAVINRNDEAISSFCREAPDRLIGFGSISPDRFRPDLKVEWAVKQLGLKGIKIYPHSGFYPNDRRLDRVYQKCVDLDIPVVIHTGIKAIRMQWIKYNDPIHVDDVATNFPELNVVMSHGGYPWVEQFLTVAYSNPNVWVDITFLDYIEKTFAKEGLAEETIRRLADLVGIERMLWGSEGPSLSLPLFGQHGPGHYEKSMHFLVNRFTFLSDKDKENILGGNAARLLKLSQ